MSAIVSNFFAKKLTNSNVLQSFYSSFKVLSINEKNCIKSLTLGFTSSQLYSNSSNKPNAGKFVNASGNLEEKQFPKSPKITLIKENGEKEVTYLEQAEKIAKHSNKKLIKVYDDYKKPVYKIVREQYQMKKEKRKQILFGPDILQNDMTHKVNQVCKLLQKGKSVVVSVNKKNPELCETVIQSLKSSLGPDMKMPNKIEKGTLISLILEPTNEESKGDHVEEKGKS